MLKILMLIGLLLTSSCSMRIGTCSKDWHVTGYFTPIESEYPSQHLRTIKVEKVGYKKFASAFLDTVKVEGWGKTRHGWYLGHYGHRWHKSDYPLASNGRPLQIGSIAVDPHLFSSGSKIKIPTISGQWNDQIFVATDRGSAIQDWHIDVYTGEGKRAEKVSWNITGKHHTVCRL